jgi:hypothetical protein
MIERRQRDLGRAGGQDVQAPGLGRPPGLGISSTVRVPSRLALSSHRTAAIRPVALCPVRRRAKPASVWLRAALARENCAVSRRRPAMWLTARATASRTTAVMMFCGSAMVRV